MRDESEGRAGEAQQHERGQNAKLQVGNSEEMQRDEKTDEREKQDVEPTGNMRDADWRKEEWHRNTPFARYLAMVLRSGKSATLYRTVRAIASKRALLAYQSELGEAFRPVSHVYLVRTLYALSIGYVIADITYKAIDDMREKMDRTRIAYRALDLTVWHTFASMVLPTFAVHTIVKYSGIGLNRIPMLDNFKRTKTILPVFFGLASIFGSPLAHWLDEAVTAVMNSTSRKWFAEELYGATTAANDTASPSAVSPKQ